MRHTARDEVTNVWIGHFLPGAGARYLQIADMIERAVADGRLRPGDRLPAQRQAAELLKVDLTTVTRAYAEARHRHLILARGALGSYVAVQKAELAQLLDLSMNIPPPPAGIDLNGLLDTGFSEMLRRTDADILMSYHLGGGGKVNRAAGAVWLAPIVGKVDVERIVVCPGAQAALAALILSMTQAGDVILAEPLIYPGLRVAALQLGRKVVSVAADESGMRPDALERACAEHGARLVYLNPTLQNPTTHTMPEVRRHDIARVALACGAEIIEDDPYWLLAQNAPPPLARIAPQQVTYISTLSKCLTPGLRTAYVLLPDAQRQGKFLASLRSFSLMSPPLVTGLATQWVQDGSAALLLAGIRKEARARQDIAGQILPGASAASMGGIHVWHALPSSWTSRELARSARAEGLAVTSSEAFSGEPDPPNAIRISLGGIKDRSQLAGALKRLAQLLEREPANDTDIVI
jgi:DNA-binding transcriptional MocR family regulator